MSPQPGAWKTFAGLFGIVFLYAILSPIHPLAPFLPWIALVLAIWVLTRKRVVHKGTVDIPTAPGEKVLLRKSSIRFYLIETVWRRRGGGQGVYLGRRLTQNTFGGVGLWSNGSTNAREEILRRYDGGAMLTDRRLFLVDGNLLAARLVIPVQSITSISKTGRRRDRITLAWGASSPKTAILEFRGLGRQEVEDSVGQWLKALHARTSGIRTGLTPVPQRNG